MRPQLNAGDNTGGSEGRVHRRLASMRPQLNAGDNRAAVREKFGDVRASMRPQLNAGDNANQYQCLWVEHRELQ